MRASARIAASEAALGGSRPASSAGPGGKSGFIAAARRAAQAAIETATPRSKPVEAKDIQKDVQEVYSEAGEGSGIEASWLAMASSLNPAMIRWAVNTPTSNSGGPTKPASGSITAARRRGWASQLPGE